MRRVGSQRSRSIVLLLLSAMLFSFPSVAQSQATKKVHRVGYLSAIDASTESTRIEAIRLALREAGYTEGQNLATEYRYADGKLERISTLASELVNAKVDLIIVTGGDPVIRAAKNAASTTPIVMVGGGLDPVGAGFVQSLARPGGNITGLTNLGTELSGKRLELLKAAVPKLARVAILYNAAIPGNVLQLKEIRSTAPALKVSVQALEVRDADAFETAFAVLNKQRPGGLYVPGGPVMNDNGKRITDFALKHRIPSIYSRSEFVDFGGLMSYGADLAYSYRRVAYYVDRILKGVRPGELPVEQPSKFELVINAKTAKQIGLIIPPNLLARADRVIR